MTITKIKLLNASGGFSESGPTYSIRYLVVSDSRNDGPKTVREALPFAYGDPYELGDENDELAILTDIDIDQVDEANFLSYFADLSFAYVEEEPTIYDNPILQPIEESWGFTSRERAVAVDLNNVPYMNTAGELIEHTRPTNFRTMTYVRNEASMNDALVESAKDAVNLTIWKGYAAKTVKVTSIVHEKVSSSAMIAGHYFKVTYSFEVEYETWRFRPLNAGLNHRALDDLGFTRLQPIHIGEFVVDRPVPLDLDGKSMRNPTSGVLTGTPFLLDFKDFPELEFNTIFSGL